MDPITMSIIAALAKLGENVINDAYLASGGAAPEYVVVLLGGVVPGSMKVFVAHGATD